MIHPLRLTASLGLLWALAGQRLRRMSDALGLGPLAIRAFLPRRLYGLVKQDLIALEALVRRVLFLVAMETPLPRWQPRETGKRAAPEAAEVAEASEATEAADEASPPPAPAGPPLFPVPAFRLTEPPVRDAPTPLPGERRLPAAPAAPPGPDVPPFCRTADPGRRPVQPFCGPAGGAGRPGRAGGAPAPQARPDPGRPFAAAAPGGCAAEGLYRAGRTARLAGDPLDAARCRPVLAAAPRQQLTRQTLQHIPPAGPARAGRWCWCLHSRFRHPG